MNTSTTDRLKLRNTRNIADEIAEVQKLGTAEKIPFWCNPSMLKGSKSKDDENTRESDSTNETEMMSVREKELQQMIDKQNQTIQRLEGDISKLRKTIEGYENDTDKKTTKKRKLDEVIDSLENEDLKEKVETLTEQLGERETALQETREKLAESEWQEPNSAVIDSAFIYNKLEELIERRMNQIEEKFTTMETKIEKKQMTHAKEVKPSYSNALSKNISNTTFKNVIQETKNTDRVIETERIKREKNIIIHGVSEGDGTAEENTKGDCNYVTSLFQILGTKTNPISIARLGKPIEKSETKDNTGGKEKCRPIKLIMSSSDEKDLIMSRLSNLKNAEEKYRRISVKDDYTLEERNLVKHWLKIADEQNKKEGTTKYKIRGTPKNGFRVVEITRGSQQN